MKKILFLLTLAFCLIFPARISAQDSAKIDEFSILMNTLVKNVREIEEAFNPFLTKAISRTRRLDVYSSMHPEIQRMKTLASGKSDSNSVRLLALADFALENDPTKDSFQPVLNELWVRYIVAECESRKITTEDVAAYVMRESSTFVANRGNFAHPDFDDSSLTGDDIVRIYFAGFGLVVLINMQGGVEKAIQTYESSSDLRPWFAQQYVFRACDIDVDGLPLLKTVLQDPSVTTPAREILYGLIAGKLVGPGGQYGNSVQLSPEWKTAIASLVCSHIRQLDRIENRLRLPLYGVDFSSERLTPEALLGLLGAPGTNYIIDLLESDNLVEKVSGLESIAWFDVNKYPDDAAKVFDAAEPLMANEDFSVAVLALNVFELDAKFTGESYDTSRKIRIKKNIPNFVTLISRANAEESLEYISSTAWIDIFKEGTLVNELEGCATMIGKVVYYDYQRKSEGENVTTPEVEINILSNFIPKDQRLFYDTTDAVLGFLEADLNSGRINSFTAWAYVNYLSAAKNSNLFIHENWKNALVRLRSWTQTAQLLVRGDELNSEIEKLLQ